MLIPDRLMPGTRASAWAAPIPIATGNVTSSTPLVRPPHRSASQRIDGADDQRDGDQPGLADAGLDQVVEQEAGERRRDRRGYQQPRQASVRIGGERAIAHGGARPVQGEASRPGSRQAGPPGCRCGA